MGMYAVRPIIRAFVLCNLRPRSFCNAGYPYEDVLYDTRSLVISGKQCQLDGVTFKAFEKLRALQISYSSSLQNGHLVDICELIWLRYLGLDGCSQITEFPREIGRLQDLQILRVTCARITKLPTEIGELQHLETLDVSGTEVTELPTWIEKLQSLNTLDISGTKVTELPSEIKNLECLVTLDISRTRVRELSCREVPNPLLSVVVDIDRSSGQKVKLPLGIISSSGGEEVFISSSEAKCRDELSELVLFNHFGDRCEVRPVRMLRVSGRHMKVPQWIKHSLRNVCSLDISICKLVEEDLEFLKTAMPNLQALQLRFQVLPREPVAITGGGFSKLDTFYVDCRLPRVITFEEGAMPKLKHLEFKFYSGPATSQDYCMGIEHLDSLEKVVFRYSEYYTSRSPAISAAIEAVRKEAGKHTKRGITIWVDDAIVSCDVEREVKQPDIKERRNSQLMAIEKRAQRDKYRGRGGIRS